MFSYFKKKIDLNMTYILKTHVYFLLCDENNSVISSKVHYESIFS